MPGFPQRVTAAAPCQERQHDGVKGPDTAPGIDWTPPAEAQLLHFSEGVEEERQGQDVLGGGLHVKEVEEGMATTSTMTRLVGYIFAMAFAFKAKPWPWCHPSHSLIH